LKKWVGQFSEEEMQIANKYMKQYSTPLAINGMQIKTTPKFQLSQNDYHQGNNKGC
jgi:hypothetical protein